MGYLFENGLSKEGTGRGSGGHWWHWLEQELPPRLAKSLVITVSHINFGNVPFCICMQKKQTHHLNVVCIQNCYVLVPSAMFVLSYLDILMKLPMSQCLCSFWSSWCLMFRSWRMETWSPKTSTDPPWVFKRCHDLKSWGIGESVPCFAKFS